MTNLILCTGKKASEPFLMEEVGVSVATIEEFSYMILKNGDDLDETVYSPKFTHWVRTQLGMEELADELDEMLRKKKSYSKFITAILESNDYASAAEIKEVGKILENLESKSPIELEKLRADKLLEKGRLQAAISRYETLIERETFTDNVLLGNLYNNLGTAYAGLFLYEKAGECYRDAYRLNRNMESYHSYMHAMRYVSADASYGKDVVYFQEEQAKTLKKELFELLDSSEAQIAKAPYYRLKEALESGDREAFSKGLWEEVTRWKMDYMEMMGEEL